MTKGKTTIVQTRIPDDLLAQAQALVTAGRFSTLDELMLDALRHFLASHQDKAMEEFIRQDVEWGLGTDAPQ